MQTNKTLYPLKFNPILKERIWGGQKLKTVLGKDFSISQCGESWELSTVPNDVSMVKGGDLDGRALTQLIEEFKGKLVGEKVYRKFGASFPLLIKFLDAQEDLSIQVHPDDTLAQERHNSFGKTEMWYVMQADPGATLRVGFNREINQETYLKYLQDKNLDAILNIIPAQPGDVFFLPAGRVHSIGKGLLIAEIQQTSDITYRLYDFDRKDSSGKTRELHTEQALDAIDYHYYTELKKSFQNPEKQITTAVSSDYFVTNLLSFDKGLNRNYGQQDSFVIFMGVSGEAELEYEGGKINIATGETVLLPASIKQITLHSAGQTKLLEVYVP